MNTAFYCVSRLAYFMFRKLYIEYATEMLAKMHFWEKIK